MIFAAIVAGGIGSRMGADKPKQFLEINGKPIIIHTIEKFLMVDEIALTYVLVPSDWVEYMEGLVVKAKANSQNKLDYSKIRVISGGTSRNETIMNAVGAAILEPDFSDESIIVTHDSVRPFVTPEIIVKNIEEAKKMDAVTTAINATDTILESADGRVISNVPERSTMFQCQTPQTFNARKLKEYYDMLDEEVKEKLTDATGIFNAVGKEVGIVEGIKENIKITVPFDLKLAEAILK